MWEQAEPSFKEKLILLLKRLLLHEGVSSLVCLMSAMQLAWCDNRRVGVVSKAGLLQGTPSG